MKRWHALFSSTGLPASSISNDGSGLAGNGTELDVNEPQSSSIALEPSIRFANLKQKLQLLRKDGKTNFSLEAMSDLVEEARFNKSAIVDESIAAQELSKLLALPIAQRRAVHLRDITEFGRNVHLPDSWHSTDRLRTIVWYHMMQRLKLAEFQAGDVIVREGVTKSSCCYWLLSGSAVKRSAAVMAAEAAADTAQAAAQAEADARAIQKTSTAARVRGQGGAHAERTTTHADSPRLNHATSHATTMDGGSSNRSKASTIHAIGAMSKASSLASRPARASDEHNREGGGEQDQSASAVAAMAAVELQEAMCKEPDIQLAMWELFGIEALQGAPSSCNVVATEACTLACLSVEDYKAVLARTSAEMFDNLRVVHIMLMSRAQRTPQHVKELADQLSVFPLFKTMEADMRLEVCNLVEYIHCPPGCTLFEEGDRVDFCYLVLQGRVSFTKYDEKTRRVEDLGTKGTGDHFGTLLTLSAGEKKRPFTAVASQGCELAVISRVGYNRVLKKQLHGAIEARVSLLRGLSFMRSNSLAALQKVAAYCQDEIFPAGSIITDPACPPNRIFFIMQGEAKLVWITQRPEQAPTPGLPETADSSEVTSSQSGSKSGAPSSTDGGPTAASSSASAAASTTAAGTNTGPREPALTVTQQLGASMFAAGQKLATGRQKHVIEVARLAHGDVINGVAMVAGKSVFHVVAASEMKLVSLELDVLESVVGREACSMIQDLVLASHAWAVKRLQHVLHVRQAMTEMMMDCALQRSLPEQELRLFADHYVPPGVWDLAVRQNQRLGADRGRSQGDQLEAGSSSGPVSPGPTAVARAMLLPATHSMDDVLKLPSATVPGGPSGAAKSIAAGKTTRQPAPIALASESSMSSFPQQPSYGASSLDENEPTCPTGQSSYLSAELSAANAPQLAGVSKRSSASHLGTVVGLSNAAGGRRKRAQHMGFAGGMATAILDMTTEPTLRGVGAPDVPMGSIHAHRVPSGQHTAASTRVQRPLVVCRSTPSPCDVAPLQADTATNAAGKVATEQSLPYISSVPAMSGSLRCDCLRSPRSPRQWQQTQLPALHGEASALDAQVAAVLQPLCALPNLTASCPDLRSDDSLAMSVLANGTAQKKHRAGKAAAVVSWSRRRKAMDACMMARRAQEQQRSLLTPSPALRSPALASKVVLKRMESLKSGPLCVMRSAALMSAYQGPDGGIDLGTLPVSNPGKHEHQPDAPQHGTQHGLGDEPSMMIMPHMMNVYQSVLTSEKSLMAPLGVNRHKSTSSPSRPVWMIPTQSEAAHTHPQVLGPPSRAQRRSPSPASKGSQVPHPTGTPDAPEGSLDKSPGNSSAHQSPAPDTQPACASPTPVTTAERGQDAVRGGNASLSSPAPSPSLNKLMSAHARESGLPHRGSSQRGSWSNLPPLKRSSIRGDTLLNLQDPGSVVRMVARINHEQEPSLPLDCDVAAPPLADHKLSEPTLSDLNYIIGRWCNRWSTEREYLLHTRMVEGKQLPGGLTPRTMERVLEADIERSAYQRPLTQLDTFGTPVLAPGSLV